MFLLCTLNRTTFFIQVALFPLQHAKRSVNRFCLNTAPLPSLRRTHHAQVNKCHANLRTSNKIHIYTANFALKNNFNMPSIKKTICGRTCLFLDFTQNLKQRWPHTMTIQCVFPAASQHQLSSCINKPTAQCTRPVINAKQAHDKQTMGCESQSANSACKCLFTAPFWGGDFDR